MCRWLVQKVRGFAFVPCARILMLECFCAEWAEMPGGLCLAPAWFQGTRLCPNQISLSGAFRTCSLPLAVLSSAQVAYLLWRRLVPGFSLRVVSCVPAVFPCAGLSDECAVSWPCLGAELPQVRYFHNWPSPATSCAPNFGAGSLVFKVSWA